MAFLPILCLSWSFCLLFPMFPEAWGPSQGLMEISIYGWAQPLTLSSLLGVSPLIATHCGKKTLLWPKLKVAQVYGYKHRYLEGTLTAWSFGKITIARSTLGSLASPAMDFWIRLQFRAWHSLLWNRPQIQPGSSWLSHSSHATITTGTCSWQDLSVGKTTGAFSPQQLVWYHDSWPTGREFPGGFEIDCSMSSSL